MITAILIIYSILAIVIGLFNFMAAISEDVETWMAVLVGLLTGALMPIVIAIILIISLLPIIIPCATLIYLFG